MQTDQVKQISSTKKKTWKEMQPNLKNGILI